MLPGRWLAVPWAALPRARFPVLNRLFHGIDEVPGAVPVVAGGLGEGALHGGSGFFKEAGIFILRHLIRGSAAAVLAISDISVVQLDAEAGDFFVLIDGQKSVLGQGCTRAPAAVFVLVELFQSLTDHRAAVFLTAMGDELKKLLADLIEIAGAGQM